MAEPHVISALVRRRSELACDIEAAQKQITQMVGDLESLDATILMFDPDYEIEAIKPKAFRPPADWSKRGEMTRRVIEILKMASEPLTSREIALQLVANRGLDTGDAKLLRLMGKRVGVALRGLRDKGIAQSEQGPGQYMVWVLQTIKTTNVV